MKERALQGRAVRVVRVASGKRYGRVDKRSRGDSGLEGGTRELPQYGVGKDGWVTRMWCFPRWIADSGVVYKRNILPFSPESLQALVEVRLLGQLIKPLTLWNHIVRRPGRALSGPEAELCRFTGNSLIGAPSRLTFHSAGTTLDAGTLLTGVTM